MPVRIVVSLFWALVATSVAILVLASESCSIFIIEVLQGKDVLYDIETKVLAYPVSSKESAVSLAETTVDVVIKSLVHTVSEMLIVNNNNDNNKLIIDIL